MSRRPTPDETFQALADYAALQDMEDIDAMTSEEVEAELRRHGLTVDERGAKVTAGSTAQKGEGPPSSASVPDVAMACDASPRSSIRGGRGSVVVRLADRMRRATPMEMLSAAAGLLFVIVAGYALRRSPPPDVTRPTTADAAVTVAEAGPPEDPLAPARELRRQAREACDQGKWAECQGKLGKAAMVDPKGDQTPEMKALWKKTYDGVAREHGGGVDKVPQGR